MASEAGKMEEGSVTRRGAGEPTTSSASIESARRFLYDEDEPPPGNPANTPLPQSQLRPAYDDKKSRPRLNPIVAACMATCQTCRGYGLKRLLIVVGLVLLIIGFSSLAGGEPRIEAIANKVVEAGISTTQQLTTEGTAQYHALSWLSNVDKTNPDNPHILQRYAMAVFFYSTSGSSDHVNHVSGWQDQESWMTGKGICIWYGVECQMSDNGPRFNGNGAVTSLNMTGNSVGGSLPSELTALNELLVLDLSNNKLTGTLPAALSSMKSLRDLMLSNNELQGRLPSEYGKFANLRMLHLGKNKLNGAIPRDLEHVATLRQLGLENNGFEFAIPSFLDMQKLCT
jgi:hypothetical protein